MSIYNLYSLIFRKCTRVVLTELRYRRPWVVEMYWLLSWALNVANPIRDLYILPLLSVDPPIWDITVKTILGNAYFATVIAVNLLEREW